MSVTQSILFATGNPHKLGEVSAVLGETGWVVRGLDSVGRSIDEPIEHGRTFADNARLKAKYYANATGSLCLADDSGLMVDALGGEPGVISARYAGIEGPRAIVDPANNAKLIERLRTVEPSRRTGRFVCVMAVSDGRKTWAMSWGVVEGLLITEPRGTNGFGYDPLFLLPDRGVTTAELSPAEKNAVSHRGQASRRMAAALKRLGR